MKQFSFLLMMTNLILSGCSVFGIRSATPEPKFSMITKISPVEIRHYPSSIAAETTIVASASDARNQGFRRLAAYIFGANHGKKAIAMTVPVTLSKGDRIAMTAPVIQSRSAEEGWVISFYMPANYTIETLPIPDDTRIQIITVPTADYAVLRFSGNRSPKVVSSQQARLLELIAKTPWHVVGSPVVWFYDPPWTIPAFRRNEVAVEVRNTTP